MSTDAELERLLARNKAVFDWCVRSARRAQSENRFEDAAEWCHLGAFSAGFTGWFGELTSPDLESILCQLSAKMPGRVLRKKRGQGVNWLHVMTTAFDVGGHTNLVCRWIRMDCENARHHVVITDQHCPLPDKLQQVVAANGGELRVLDRGTSNIKQAQELWTMAASLADVVVLHIHPQEVSAIIAFAEPSEIPVCLMNHVDHLFWVGTTIADRVIEFRELGRQWTRSFRGVDRSVMLPIPLEEAPWNRWVDPGRYHAARERLGISKQQVVLLTIGTAYKYEPAGEWDFLRAAADILDSCPEAVLIAVGPEPKDRWAKAIDRYGKRLQALGSKTDISNGNSDYHSAADIALGSFPFASQTAILECAWLGIPCVLTPKAIPFGLDDLSFNGIDWPVTQQDYVEAAVRLIRSAALRQEQGTHLAGAVARHHCGKGWMGYLDRLRAAIPPKHELHKTTACSGLDSEACALWAELNKLSQSDALDHIHGRIISKGFNVTPYHDKELMAALRNGSSTRSFPGLRFKWRKTRFQAGKLRRTLFRSK
jgi:hypothetical protein